MVIRWLTNGYLTNNHLFMHDFDKRKYHFLSRNKPEISTSKYCVTSDGLTPLEMKIVNFGTNNHRFLSYRNFGSDKISYFVKNRGYSLKTFQCLFHATKWLLNLTLESSPSNTYLFQIILLNALAVTG